MTEAENRWRRPREVAEQLGIPPSTLRTYATQFAALLSEPARPAAAGGGRNPRHRRYGEADLAILRQAKDLLDDGMSYAAVRRQLLGGGPLPRPRPRPAARRARPPDPPPIAPSARPSPEASPASPDTAPAALARLADRLGAIEARLARLEALLRAAPPAPPRTSWLARLIGGSGD